MKAPREWTEEQTLFAEVSEALELAVNEHSFITSVSARDEEDSYGSRGYIRLRTRDGRIFTLELYEER